MGDPTVLNVEALVNPTPITSSDKKGLGARILEVGGPELAKQLSGFERPKTGEVRPTPGYNVVAPTILHTIGPRYSDHYMTAAENALHNCYRSAFDYCVEHRIRTLAIPPIHSLHRQYPTLLGAHIALRTLRCLMDVRPSALQRLVLCFDPNDNENLDTYYALMKLYFPRNEQEEAAAVDQLPDFKGNEFGETIMLERQVRIQASFSDEHRSSTYGTSGTNSGRDGGVSSSWSSSSSVITSSSSSTPPYHDDSIFRRDLNSFPSSMMYMSAYKDDERRKQSGVSPSGPSAPGFEDLYTQYLAIANTANLSQVSQLGIVYHAGNDRYGRPIIIIVGCRIPNDHKLHDLVFLYYIKFMDKFADSPYVLLYIHTNVSSKKKPPISWFRKVYSIMDGKYSRSLVSVHVLHPTFWLKVVEKLVSVFMSADAIISKIVYYERLIDLCTQLRLIPRLPNDILQYDAAINGPMPPQFEETLK